MSSTKPMISKEIIGASKSTAPEVKSKSDHSAAANEVTQHGDTQSTTSGFYASKTTGPEVKTKSNHSAATPEVTSQGHTQSNISSFIAASNSSKPDVTNNSLSSNLKPLHVENTEVAGTSNKTTNNGETGKENASVGLTTEDAHYGKEEIVYEPYNEMVSFLDFII